MAQLSLEQLSCGGGGLLTTDIDYKVPGDKLDIVMSFGQLEMQSVIS